MHFSFYLIIIRTHHKLFIFFIKLFMANYRESGLLHHLNRLWHQLNGSIIWNCVFNAGKLENAPGWSNAIVSWSLISKALMCWKSRGEAWTLLKASLTFYGGHLVANREKPLHGHKPRGSRHHLQESASGTPNVFTYPCPLS